MSTKKEYFIKRNSSLSKDNRAYAAKREIETIKFILKTFFNFELTAGMNILDLGSGDKFLKNEFMEKGMIYKDYDINDIDFEIDKFKDEDDTFDLVVSLAVLEHIKNPNLFLSECKRVLKKNSHIYLSTPNWKYSKDTFWDDPTHVKPYSEESLKDILTLKGFRNVEILPNLRCKPKWWYEGKFKFFKAYYLLPFKGDTKFIPNFLKGKSKGLFAIGKK
jgi:SAM-dependent methyltransferase